MSGTKKCSIRVATAVFEDLERRAREVAESRNVLAERYIAEGIRLDEHPEIAFRDGPFGRRAIVAGTRLAISQVMGTVRAHDDSVEAAAEYLSLPPTKVRAAVRYYAAHRSEVDEVARRETAAADRAEAAWRAPQELRAE
jgi:uncharacterized protein (DUF433 family)